MLEEATMVLVMDSIRPGAELWWVNNHTVSGDTRQSSRLVQTLLMFCCTHVV